MTIHLPFFFAILIYYGLVVLTGKRKEKMYRLQQQKSVYLSTDWLNATQNGSEHPAGTETMLPGSLLLA